MVYQTRVLGGNNDREQKHKQRELSSGFEKSVRFIAALPATNSLTVCYPHALASQSNPESKKGRLEKEN
jgi:hypothetical protein